MELIWSLIFSIPCAILLIVFGIILIRYNFKEFKKKREEETNYDIMGVEIQGYATGGWAIILGLIILYGIIFEKFG